MPNPFSQLDLSVSQFFDCLDETALAVTLERKHLFSFTGLIDSAQQTVTIPSATTLTPILWPIGGFGYFAPTQAVMHQITATAGVSINGTTAGTVALSATPYAPVILQRIGLNDWRLFKAGSAGGTVQSVTGANQIAVDNTDPANPVVGNPAPFVQAIVAGTNVSVDATDPLNPIVSSSGSATFSGARICKSSAQSIASSTSTEVQWSVETGAFFDQGGWFDSGTDAGAFIVPAGVSKVVVSACVIWADNATGLRCARIKLGGSDVAILKENAAATGTLSAMGQVLTSGVLAVSPTNRISLEVVQSSGGNLNLTDLSGNYFSIMRVE